MAHPAPFNAELSDSRRLDHHERHVLFDNEEYWSLLNAIRSLRAENFLHQLSTLEGISIGIGRGLTASPLPHHRTYGSRIRRFGRCNRGRYSPQPKRLLPLRQWPVHPGVEHTIPRLSGCQLATPLQATTPLYRSGLQHAPACLLGPLLPPACRPAMISHRSVPPDSSRPPAVSCHTFCA